MNSTNACSWIRRWGPTIVVTVVIVVTAGVYHRTIVAWFGWNPDAIFGTTAGAVRHDADELHTAGSMRVGLHVDPHRPIVGKNRLTADIRTADGKPVGDARVEAMAVMPAMGAMPEMRAAAPMTHAGDGRYTGDIELTMNGGWPLTLTIKSPTQGDATLHFDMATTIEGVRLTDAAGDGPARSANAASIGAVNDVCPVLGKNVPADAKTVIWNGHTIGFCCPPCEDDWNALADPEKQAFVDRFVKDGKPHVAAEHSDRTKKTIPPKEGIAYWTCSMHPSVKSKDKGTCPICKMDLTPVTHEEVQSGVIFVDAQRRQSIGVRTTTAMKQPLEKTIRAVGIVAYDETRLTDVTLKYRGWIGDLFADYTGRHVRKDEPLFTIYSPELMSAQQEYLDAIAATSVPGRTTRVADSARQRLRLWDLTDDQIEQLAKRGEPLQYIPVLAPATGTIVQKSVVRGTAVEAGRMIFRIADLSSVWIEAELYEDEISLIRPGQVARVAASYLPDQSFEGKVSYIYPYLDPKTRRGRVRFEVPNSDGLLKPDMYASVYLTIDLGSKLAVPEEAVLYGGENNVVFLDLGEGRIRPQRVKLGVRASESGLGMDLIEIVEGLKPGDTVVTSGNFLIASESKLKSGIEKW